MIIKTIFGSKFFEAVQQRTTKDEIKKNKFSTKYNFKLLPF